MSSQFRKKYDFIFSCITTDMRKAGLPLPELLSPGDHVLEYGAGTGEATYRCAKEYPQCQVHGVDLHGAFNGVFAAAERELGDTERLANLHFHQMGATDTGIAIAHDDPATVDRSYMSRHKFKFVFSWCVFEHVDLSIIQQTMRDIYECLADDGVLYLKINPLFFSQRGSHLNSIVPEPWAHLLYEHNTLKTMFYAAAAEKKQPHADLMWHQYETLNRITADDLSDVVKEAGFTVKHEVRMREGTPPRTLAHAYSDEALKVKDIVLVCTR